MRKDSHINFCATIVNLTFGGGGGGGGEEVYGPDFWKMLKIINTKIFQKNVKMRWQIAMLICDGKMAY